MPKKPRNHRDETEKLYTVLLYRASGPPTVQVSGFEVNDAAETWVETIAPVLLPEASDEELNELREDIQKYPPVLLEECTKAWCGSGLAGDRYVSINLVATAISNEERAALYTLVFDWQEGTYITQLVCSGPRAASAAWIEELEIVELLDRTPEGREEIKRAVLENDPSAIEGCTNVWLISTVADGLPAQLHIVRTEAESD